MSECDRVQTLYAEQDPAAFDGDREARVHVADCAYCQQVLAAMARIDVVLPRLPAEDAPAAVVARVAAAASPQATPEARPAPAFSGPGWASVAASVLVVVAAATLLWPQLPYLRERGLDILYRPGIPLYSSSGSYPVADAPEFRSEMVPDARRTGPGRRFNQFAESSQAPAQSALELRDSLDSESDTSMNGAFDGGASRTDSPVGALAGLKREFAGSPPAPAEAPRREVESRRKIQGEAAAGAANRAQAEYKRQRARLDDVVADEQRPPAPPAVARLEPEKEALLEAEERAPVAASEVGRELLAPGQRADADKSQAPGPPTLEDRLSKLEAAKSDLQLRQSKSKDSSAGAVTSSGTARGAGLAPSAPPAPPLTALFSGLVSAPVPSANAPTNAPGRSPRPKASDKQTQAADYLAAREHVTGLGFMPANGYWSNAYVPGDPALRLLELRLREWDRSRYSNSFASLRLERRVRPGWQPFDPPGEAALAVYVQADRAAVQGPSRVRLQVGLRGAERRGGHRPAMNVAVVVDRRQPLDQRALVRVRALLDALVSARQPGDRFSLTIAGPGGGIEVHPESFRHGPLVVALESLASPPVRSRFVSLHAAVGAAAGVASADDDPSAPIGASVVLLLASAPLGAEAKAIESLAHANALGGVVTSVVAVGEGADEAGTARLVLLGQGRRAVLTSAADAPPVVDRELHAASRAVARAVRLRIQLAPGVRLVEVLGARRLDEPAAERVREAEQGIDRRLARNLGIVGDRGEDEAGVQIVIPHFYAGDSHVVLLDVVAEGPGPVADVTVRYKDLVRLANGTASASLSLAAGEDSAGPLQLNVFKNELAQRLSEAARDAGEQLAAGHLEGAVARIAHHRSLVAGLRTEIPALRADPELQNDLVLLDEYLTVLRGRLPDLRDPGARREVADSLRGAAHRRLLDVPDAGDKE